MKKTDDVKQTNVLGSNYDISCIDDDYLSAHNLDEYLFNTCIAAVSVESRSAGRLVNQHRSDTVLLRLHRSYYSRSRATPKIQIVVVRNSDRLR